MFIFLFGNQAMAFSDQWNSYEQMSVFCEIMALFG